MEANVKMVKARAGLILDAPFFGALALRLKLVEDTSCETAWTDGITLGYNPTFIDSLSLEETKGLWGHEVMHPACGHHVRRQGREKERWNDACDHAINPLLLEAGFRLPTGALLGYSKDDYAESIYNKLPQDDQGGGGQGQGDGNEDGKGSGGGFGEVRDLPGKDGGPASKAELAQAEADAKVAVKQAATVAKSWGRLPAGLERLVEDLLEPHIPWREVLRRFIDQCSRNDYTWTKPASRYMASGLYLPSLYNQEMRPIAIAIDTSMSIGQDELDQFAAEISDIIHEVKASATVIYCDSKVAKVEEYTPNDEVKLRPYGGGGTDFIPPFVEVEARGLDPACLVYLTDGECSSFPDAPEYPVLWGVTGRRFSPPFGEVMEVQV